MILTKNKRLETRLGFGSERLATCFDFSVFILGFELVFFFDREEIKK